MSRDTRVSVSEIRRLYDLLAEVQDLFHQPLYYEDPGRVQRFADEYYGEIHDLYYNVVWEWLPEEERRKIEEGD